MVEEILNISMSINDSKAPNVCVCHPLLVGKKVLRAWIDSNTGELTVVCVPSGKDDE